MENSDSDLNWLGRFQERLNEESPSYILSLRNLHNENKFPLSRGIASNKVSNNANHSATISQAVIQGGLSGSQLLFVTFNRL